MMDSQTDYQQVQRYLKMTRYNPWKKVWKENKNVIIIGAIVIGVLAALGLTGCVNHEAVTVGWHADSSSPQADVRPQTTLTGGSPSTVTEYAFPIYNPEALQ